MVKFKVFRSLDFFKYFFFKIFKVNIIHLLMTSNIFFKFLQFFKFFSIFITFQGFLLLFGHFQKQGSHENWSLENSKLYNL